MQRFGYSEVVPARPTPAPVKVPPVPPVPRAKAKATPGEKKFPQDDTLGNSVTSYFATLTAEPFSYGGKEYLPRELYVSPGIVRGFTCPGEHVQVIEPLPSTEAQPMFTRRPPALPPSEFPLVLRREWRTDRPNPRLGRLRALALITTSTTTPRSAPYRFAAE